MALLGRIKMTKKIIQTRTAKLWLREEGIIQCEVKPNIRNELIDVIEMIDAGRVLGGGTKAPVLMDIRKAGGVSRDGRVYFSGHEACQIVSATAILIESKISQMIATFFLGFNRVPYPIQIFTRENEAVEWLKKSKPVVV